MKSGPMPGALNTKSENWPALGDPQEIASAMGDRASQITPLFQNTRNHAKFNLSRVIQAPARRNEPMTKNA